MPFGNSDDPRVTSIVVAPDHRLIAPNSKQQITVTAHYSDGSRRDVTTQAEYSSNYIAFLHRAGNIGIAIDAIPSDAPDTADFQDYREDPEHPVSIIINSTDGIPPRGP